MDLMRTVSLILRKKPEFGFYNQEGLLDYVRALNPENIFLTVRGSEPENPGYSVMSGILRDPELSKRVRDVSVELKDLEGLESEFNSSISGDPALIAKKKMLDMFTDTIYSYLGGTWKDFESLNSHDTHTIFKARYLLISSVLPEYVSKHYFPVLHSISEKIENEHPGASDVIISDIEWSFWFRDNVK